MRDKDRQELVRVTEAVEQAIRALGVVPPTEAPRGAFGLENMAFSEWVAGVLLPRLRDVLAGRIPLPPDSQVGAQAVRELDGWPEASDLVTALSDLDALVRRVRRHPGT